MRRGKHCEILSVLERVSVEMRERSLNVCAWTCECERERKNNVLTKIVNFVFSFQDSTLGSHRSFHLDPDDSGLQRNRAYASDHRRFGEIPWPEEDGKPRETARKRRGTQEACSTQTFPQRAKGEGRPTKKDRRDIDDYKE